MPRRYSKDEIIRAIAVANASPTLRAAAATTGIPRTTLRDWLNGDRRPDLQVIVQDVRERTADQLYTLQSEAFDLLAERIRSGKLSDNALVDWIKTSMMQAALVEGRPTEIVGQPVSVMSDEQRALIARLLDEKVRQLETGER